MRNASIIADVYRVEEYLLEENDLTTSTLSASLPSALKDNHFARVLIPCNQHRHTELLMQRGYFFVDRVVETRASVKHPPQEQGRARFAIEDKPLSASMVSCIQDVACRSFLFDSRFRLRREYDPVLASCLLQYRITEAQERGDIALCALLDGELAGFALLQRDNRNLRIGLAAVEKRFQASGISADLYAAAYARAKQDGFGFLAGTVSTANTAVVNLYVMLGARFSCARDVYILAGGERL